MAVFSVRLLELRRKLNITQQQLSDVLEISRATIGMYEIGKRDPDINTLIRLADYFNVSVDYLIGRKDEELDLPQEALKEIDSFKQYIRYKYNL